MQNNFLVESIAIKEVPNWDQRRAYDLVMGNMEQKLYNTIITHNEVIASGVIQYLKEKNLFGQVTLTTTGINKDLVENINNNYLVSAVDTLPNLVSQFALKAASNLVETDTWEYDLQIKNGLASVPAKIIPVRLIIKDNIYLLKERFDELKNQEKEEDKAKVQEKSEEKKGTEGGSGKQSQLKVKTKDGKEFEVTIPGEIQGVEVVPSKEK